MSITGQITELFEDLDSIQDPALRNRVAAVWHEAITSGCETSVTVSSARLSENSEIRQNRAKVALKLTIPKAG